VVRRGGETVAHHSPVKGSPGTIDCDATKHVVMGLARKSPAVWFENFGRIVDKEGELIKPKINTLQRRVFDAWQYCQQTGIPCRIILCKPRQKGSSTWATALLYWICQAVGQTTRARIIGGKYSQVKNLWDMLRVYGENDGCIWPRGKATVLDDRVTVGPSEITKETANNPDAGRSGTFRVVIVTELGRWREAGVAAAKKVLSGMLNCVPKEPGTLVIIESTAQGIGGEFHSRYWKASPLAAFKAGRRGSGYIRVFAAWFEFPDSWQDLTDDEARAIEEDLDDEEKMLRDRYDLVLEQLAWRRATIADDCDGDTDLFKQEFPSNEEEAFLSSGRPRFSRRGLDMQLVMAEEAERERETGNIHLSDDYLPSWEPTDEAECVYHLYERPREGMRYILSLDPATGAMQAMGEDPDCNSATVLRAGYLDDQGQWHQPALAARIRAPRRDYRDANRWDPDVLEPAIYALALFYGNCRIVVEMNKDMGYIELLKRRGNDPAKPNEPAARLYEREVFNEREQRKVKALGWQTTESNREALLITLAGAIRSTGEDGGGIELRCPHLVQECVHFERNEKGKSVASGGWHDDDVMSVAIGLQCIGHATTYRVPKVQRLDPPEVRRIKAKVQAKRRPGMYS
jgi:hypothetical protein